MISDKLAILEIGTEFSEDGHEHIIIFDKDFDKAEGILSKLVDKDFKDMSNEEISIYAREKLREEDIFIFKIAEHHLLESAHFPILR